MPVAESWGVSIGSKACSVPHSGDRWDRMYRRHGWASVCDLVVGDSGCSIDSGQICNSRSDGMGRNSRIGVGDEGSCGVGGNSGSVTDGGNSWGCDPVSSSIASKTVSELIPFRPLLPSPE